jgi:hypothetical protein
LEIRDLWSQNHPVTDKHGLGGAQGTARPTSICEPKAPLLEPGPKSLSLPARLRRDPCPDLPASPREALQAGRCRLVPKQASFSTVLAPLQGASPTWDFASQVLRPWLCDSTPSGCRNAPFSSPQRGGKSLPGAKPLDSVSSNNDAPCRGARTISVLRSALALGLVTTPQVENLPRMSRIPRIADCSPISAIHVIRGFSEAPEGLRRRQRSRQGCPRLTCTRRRRSASRIRRQIGSKWRGR